MINFSFYKFLKCLPNSDTFFSLTLILLALASCLVNAGWSTLALANGNIIVKSLSPVQLFATPWTVAYQAPPSMGFSRQGYWSGLLSPSPGDLSDPGMEPWSPTLPADTFPFEPL